MGRMIVEAATSIDGYWVDAEGVSVFPIDAQRRARMVARLSQSCGAVVMSAKAFAAAGEPDWYADNYELQVPIFVVTERVPVPAPRENARLRFHFLPDFASALAAAECEAGDKAVLVIGGARTVTAALSTGRTDEIWLHVMARTLGRGAPLFDEDMPFADYFVSEMENTPSAVHMRLERRCQA
ncbi:dihydrofolate reductase family protein [Novosphingobium sp. KA1]|uniref:dihydrofolate reductase family protein n=1 Tax=Novosphingobium sp. (strain KA1) TaxID=164608 RepID=UPI001A8E4815|nr:dihydrofolate reductase family protein [Novosphingobium sp. KA1]QSR19749.1 riboflavin biosynthesis protein RibD [Novosphingobium sp. KA1]